MIHYFTNLFHTSQNLSKIKYTSPQSPHNVSDLLKLGDIPTELEICGVVDSFQPYKAPEPDGIHPFFYQNYWNTVVNQSYLYVQKHSKKNTFLTKLTKPIFALYQRRREPIILRTLDPLAFVIQPTK